ncbi:MAG: hypothetical protein ABWK01_03860 [Infirmifilum sp.]
MYGWKGWVLILRKDKYFNILLPALYGFTVTVLSSLGEKRIDVYISMLTLEYTVLYATLKPKRGRGDILLAILVFVFLVFALMRILEVLGL